jgi:hypothetical protein
LYLKPPQSTPFPGRRPTTQFSRVAAVLHEGNPRYRQDNIITLELDLPERTTQDFEEIVGR